MKRLAPGFLLTPHMIVQCAVVQCRVDRFSKKVRWLLIGLNHDSQFFLIWPRRCGIRRITLPSSPPSPTLSYSSYCKLSSITSSLFSPPSSSSRGTFPLIKTNVRSYTLSLLILAFFSLVHNCHCSVTAG